MLASQVHDLRSLCMRLLAGKCPARPRAVVVGLEHHPLSILGLQSKNLRQHLHHEIHRRIVIVQELDLEYRRVFFVAG